MDASNASNPINRNVFLHNVTIICPAIALYLMNCYSLHSRLFIIGGNEIGSCEGTIQGDLISMATYAIAVTLMILMIVDSTSKIDDSTRTADYADDVTAAGKVIQLILVENTLHSRSQIRILPRSIEIMVNCKRKS